MALEAVVEEPCAFGSHEWNGYKALLIARPNTIRPVSYTHLHGSEEGSHASEQVEGNGGH